MTEESIFFRDPSYLNAIIGCTEEGSVCYSYHRMLDCLMDEDGMSWEEAAEFIDYNTLRSLPYAPSMLGGVGPTIIYELEYDFELQDEIDRIRKEDLNE